MKALPLEFRAAALAVLLLGCSEEEGAPSLPPLARLELKGPGATSGAPPCVARGADPRQSIAVEVEVDNFTLRPPLACTVNECGTVRLTLTQGGVKISTDSAQPITSLSTAAFADGTVRIEAELLDTFGESYRSRDDLAARCTDCQRSFSLQANCGDEPPAEPEPVSSEPEATALEDAGSTTETSGGESSNTSSVDTNTELTETDAGIPASDASAPPPDAGQPGNDAGSDAGVPALTDAAVPIVDAAVPSAQDASPADAAALSDATAPL